MIKKQAVTSEILKQDDDQIKPNKLVEYSGIVIAPQTMKNVSGRSMEVKEGKGAGKTVLSPAVG